MKNNYDREILGIKILSQFKMGAAYRNYSQTLYKKKQFTK